MTPTGCIDSDLIIALDKRDRPSEQEALERLLKEHESGSGYISLSRSSVADEEIARYKDVAGRIRQEAMLRFIEARDRALV